MSAVPCLPSCERGREDEIDRIQIGEQTDRAIPASRSQRDDAALLTPLSKKPRTAPAKYESGSLYLPR